MKASGGTALAAFGRSRGQVEDLPHLDLSRFYHGLLRLAGVGASRAFVEIAQHAQLDFRGGRSGCQPRRYL
jgi:hypothetical protein